MMNRESNQDVNEVLSAVVLMQRIIPRLNPNTRETVKRQSLLQIKQSITIVIRSLKDYCTEPLILTPIMEVMALIDTVVSDDTFAETDNETKLLIVDRLSTALDQLYLFAGKFYMTHHFTWSLSKNDVLKEIVKNCLELGFYFDYDKKLKEEGLL